MNDHTILEKLATAKGGVFEKLDERKSKRMGGAKTNYIPTVAEVAKVIRAIPKGETRTIYDIRSAIAKKVKTDTSCPAAVLKYWKWMANLSDDLKLIHREYDIPWWRVLKDGKPSRHMPGGVINQKRILKSEGAIVFPE